MKWLVRERLSRNHPSRSKGTKSQCCTKDGTIVQLTLLQCRLTKKCSKTLQIIHIYVIALFSDSRALCKKEGTTESERGQGLTQTHLTFRIWWTVLLKKKWSSIYLLLCLWTREIESYVLYYYFYFMSGIIRIIWKSQISPAAASFLKLKKKFIHPKVSKTTASITIWI